MYFTAEEIKNEQLAIMTRVEAIDIVTRTLSITLIEEAIHDERGQLSEILKNNWDAIIEQVYEILDRPYLCDIDIAVEKLSQS